MKAIYWKKQGKCFGHTLTIFNAKLTIVESVRAFFKYFIHGLWIYVSFFDKMISKYKIIN